MSMTHVQNSKGPQEEDCEAQTVVHNVNVKVCDTHIPFSNGLHCKGIVIVK